MKKTVLQNEVKIILHLCLLITLLSAFLTVGEASTLYDKIIIYGRKTCSFTSQLREYLLENDIEFIFKDIDGHQGANSEMWEVVNTASWYTGDGISLPIVDINNTILERPDHAYLLSLTGNGIINNSETGVISGSVKDSSGEAIIAEINLVRISESSEYWHVCQSNTQGLYTCNQVFPGEYKVVIRYNSNIGNKPFLNSFVNSGQTFSVLAQNTLDVGNTVISQSTLTPGFTLPLTPSNGYVFWNNPNSGDTTSKYIYFDQYSSFKSVNTYNNSITTLVNDGGYLNDVKYSATKKIIATLSQANRKLYIVDADPASDTFQNIIKTVANLPAQPTDLALTDSGDIAYVVCNGGKSIAEVELSSGTITATISLSGYPQDITLNESKKEAYAGVYTGLLPANQLAVIDLDPQSPNYRSVLEYIPIGNNGCYSQQLNYPHVYSKSREGIDRIDLSTKTVTSSFLSTYIPPMFAVNSNKEKIYYVNYDDKSLQNLQLEVFDLNQGEITQRKTLPAGHNYFRLTLSNDQSTLILNSNKREIYTFTVKESGELQFSGIPDLMILSSDVNSSNLEPGDSFTTSAIVKNQGSDTSASTTLNYYLSTDSAISTEDTLLSTQTVDSLQPNTTAEKTLNTTAPAEPGTYWIGACVDPVSGEQNTDNNCSNGVPITVQEQTYPDLVALSSNVNSPELFPGATFTANTTVKNQGSKKAAETSLRFYCSTDSTISTEDILLSTLPVASLQPNATAEQTVNAVTPDTPGTYWIGACVDSVSGEQNTENNCSNGIQITVQEQTYPDLVALSSNVNSPELFPGATFTASTTVKNQGSATSTDTMLQYYLSSDSTISTEDTLLSAQPVDSLQPNTIAEKTLNTTAPDTPGTYWIGACIDSVSEEQNTDNNCSNAVKITVSAEENKPDLVVASLHVTHFSTDSIQYTYTIKNIGDRAANLEGISIKAFLSHDTSFDNTEDIPAGETIIGTSPPGYLEPGETYSGSFAASATVDINTTPYLVLMADSGAVVDEKDESNNTLAIKIENKFPWILFYPAIYNK